MGEKSGLEKLRSHLFDTIDQLKNKENPMEIDRAKAVAQVAGVILDSAKVEIGYLRVSGADIESDFIAVQPRLPEKRTAALGPAPSEPPAEPLKGSANTHKAGLAACLDCGEKFPDAKALGIHRTRVHFTGDAAMARRNGG